MSPRPCRTGGAGDEEKPSPFPMQDTCFRAAWGATGTGRASGACRAWSPAQGLPTVCSACACIWVCVYCMCVCACVFVPAAHVCVCTCLCAGWCPRANGHPGCQPATHSLPGTRLPLRGWAGWHSEHWDPGVPLTGALQQLQRMDPSFSPPWSHVPVTLGAWKSQHRKRGTTHQLCCGL